MKYLRKATYREISTDRFDSEWKDAPHYYRFRNDDGRQVHLVCKHCGEVRSFLNVDYVKWYIKRKETERLERLKAKKSAPSEVKFDKIDYKHMYEGLINYEGNLAQDLLQPYLPDGSVNEAFVKAYGKNFYEDLKRNV